MSLLAGCNARSKYVAPIGPMPPNTVLLSGMMQDLSAKPGFTEAMLAELDKGGKNGPALLTPKLVHHMREHGITRVFCAGLATDFCVAWSALDAREAGFEVVVIEDACRGIDTGGSLAAAWKALDEAGVRRCTSDALPDRPS